MPIRQGRSLTPRGIIEVATTSNKAMGKCLHGLHHIASQVGRVRYSKYATFIAAPGYCKADEAARLFIKHIVKFWGVLKSIMSDRDPRFTKRFWTELFKMLGTNLKFSTSFHPQMDGQTERINDLLEMYLRHYMSVHQ